MAGIHVEKVNRCPTYSPYQTIINGYWGANDITLGQKACVRNGMPPCGLARLAVLRDRLARIAGGVCTPKLF
jgi:hypothetical protein